MQKRKLSKSSARVVLEHLDLRISCVLHMRVTALHTARVARTNYSWNYIFSFACRLCVIVSWGRPTGLPCCLAVAHQASIEFMKANYESKLYALTAKESQTQLRA